MRARLLLATLVGGVVWLAACDFDTALRARECDAGLCGGDGGSIDAGSIDAGSTDAGGTDAGSTDGGGTMGPDGGTCVAEVSLTPFVMPLPNDAAGCHPIAFTFHCGVGSAMSSDAVSFAITGPTGHGRLYADSSCVTPLTNNTWPAGARVSGATVFFDTRDTAQRYSVGIWEVSAGISAAVSLSLQGQLVFEQYEDGGAFPLPAGTCTALPSLRLQGLTSNAPVLSDSSDELSINSLDSMSPCVVPGNFVFPSGVSTYASGLSMRGDAGTVNTRPGVEDVQVMAFNGGSLLRRAVLPVHVCLASGQPFVNAAECCNTASLAPNCD